jgi:hypothetical protein
MEAVMHGEDGHVCDRDCYPSPGDIKFKGPHVTRLVRACGDPTKWRSNCACGYWSDLKDSMPVAQVAGWLHLRRMSKAPRAHTQKSEE